MLVKRVSDWDLEMLLHLGSACKRSIASELQPINVVMPIEILKIYLTSKITKNTHVQEKMVNEFNDKEIIKYNSI